MGIPPHKQTNNQTHLNFKTTNLEALNHKSVEYYHPSQLDLVRLSGNDLERCQWRRMGVCTIGWNGNGGKDGIMARHDPFCFLSIPGMRLPLSDCLLVPSDNRAMMTI